MNDGPSGTAVAGQILVLVVLTMVNAFFAGAEMAVVSVNKTKIRKLEEEGNKKAALITKLFKDSTSFLSTIQVAITFAGFFSSASAATGISKVLAGKMAELGIPYSGTLASFLITIVLAYFNLVLGELVPKRIALQKAEVFSLFAVRPIYYISRVMGPFIKLLSLSTNGILHLVGMKSENLEASVSEEEIKIMLETGSEAGVFNEIEKEMITSIFSFDDKKAKEVMTPRQDVVGIDLARPLSEHLDEVIQSMHSRIPVYEEEIDNIVGILSMKEFMIQAKEKTFYDVDIRSIMQKPYFVPENRRTDELFKEMQKKRLRMTVLIDEYGGVAGIVTIEDLIEEIVGDIMEEYEEEDPEIVELGMNEYQLYGGLSLYEINQRFHMDINSQCDTLSGCLIEYLGYIPDEKKLPVSLEIDGKLFIIESMSERVIDSVKMEIRS